MGMGWEKWGSDIVITPYHVFAIYAVLIAFIIFLIKREENSSGNR